MQIGEITMADKVLGLAGPGRGPWVCTANLRNPQARITGLASGSIKIFGSVAGKDHDAELVTELDCDGRHPLKFFPFLKAVYDTGTSKMILTFCEGVRSAVPSA